MNKEQESTKQKKLGGLNIAISLVSGVLGTYTIFTDKMGELPEIGITGKFALLLGLLIIIYLVNLALSQKNAFLKFLSYTVLIGLIGYFFYTLLWNEQGNNDYVIGNLEWSSANNSKKIGDAPLNKSNDSIIDGRYYSYEEAREACSELKGGWRLPNESEFRQLANFCGKTINIAYEEIVNGNCKVKLKLTGNYDPETKKVIEKGKMGYYWTNNNDKDNTDNITVMVLNGRLDENPKKIDFDGYSPEVPRNKFSCRCVRNVNE
ncbi:FISUMP domain-containing protein [uncultured Winogradskyella sp.]|uniref:FISUMP domain-containing protein n=1 Tax=uncultured Winogradskyella sp. TaxID=395353 RepID=UPI00262E6471|nr:FISUMP domain-containing protein [uncultured Winogradskyella sp.]